jgi:hypothetical protein
MLRIAFILTFALITSASYGQFWKKKKKALPPSPTAQPTTVNPLPQKDYAPRASKKSPSKGATYESEQRYYERMEQLEKTRRKNEKLQQKPQYSDPMYFGHKRPPKKRKAGKLKYCKECGIRH